jgi:hypothetical protein
MSTETIAQDRLDQPAARTAFRNLKALVAGYAALSFGTMVAVFVMRNDSSKVTSPVWVRGSIVLATSLLMYSFATAAAKGRARAFLRLRIVSAVMLVAIVVIVSIPGAFPVWMRVEQGVCGVLLLGVVGIANSRNLRSLFAA